MSISSRKSGPRLAPQRMYNAYSYFVKDGQISGWIQSVDEFWSKGASCERRDGIKARFFCAVNYFYACSLNPNMGVGRAGLLCTCGRFTGRIIKSKKGSHKTDKIAKEAFGKIQLIRYNRRSFIAHDNMCRDRVCPSYPTSHRWWIAA